MSKLDNIRMPVVLRDDQQRAPTVTLTLDLADAMGGVP